MRKAVCILALSFIPLLSEASGNASGYISLHCIGGTTYQATVIDYTLFCGGLYQDQDTIRLFWGDGTYTLLYRINRDGDTICSCTKRNTYTGFHTYPGPGSYSIYANLGTHTNNVINMLNSANQDMILFHNFTIGSLAGDSLNSPVIKNEPICSYGCTGDCYKFNLDAHSPMGDSLSYALKNDIGVGYYIPINASINQVTGEITWCNPQSIGLYSFSICIVTYKRFVINGRPIQMAVDTEEVELQVSVQTSCPLSTMDISPAITKAVVYPNPNDGKFTLQEEGQNQADDVEKKAYRVEVYNLLGKLVYLGAMKSASEEITLDGNPNGVYFYKVISNDTSELISEGKFIVSK